MGYFIALIFIGISVFFYSRNLLLKSSLDEATLDYENLLSEKFQLEKSYYRIKEGRPIDNSSESYFRTAAQFNDSLKAMKKQQQQEVARLYRKIEELRVQISKNQKIN